MTLFDPEQFSYRRECDDDGSAIEALLDTAFGPGRHVLTTYRLREGVDDLRELALVGEKDGELVGTMRFWPVVIGEGTPALLLGPLAIDPPRRNQGCGLGLMRRGLERARDAGHRLVILVGDLPYYARAGFTPVPDGQILLPGPVDRRRLLYFELVPGALEAARGLVGKASSRA